MKRVVLVHTKGRFEGLWQIQGTEDALRNPENKDALLPDMVGPFEITAGGYPGHQNGASLIKSRPRYVLYREFRDELVGVPGGTMRRPEQK